MSTKEQGVIEPQCPNCWEDRLIDKIDRRTKKRTNLDNIDRSFNNYTLTPEGDRVWSF